MKILHVISNLCTGGAERLVTELLPRFKQDGIEADVLLFDGTDTPFKKKLLDAGVIVFELSKGGSVYNPLNIFRLISYFKKYDIVHTHGTAPQLFAAVGSVLCSVVLVTTEHTTSNRRRGWKWYAPIDRWMYTRYKKIICISDKTELCLKKHLRKNLPTICIVNNGIDTGTFFNAQPDAKFCTIYKDYKRMIMVSRFAPAKDQKTVIRTIKILPEDYHVFFVGDGPTKPDCEELTMELEVSDRVHFLGIRSDIPQLLKSCDIAILSSHWDGFGLAAVEGMAAHKPVIASNVDGLREVVSKAGLLFEHENTKDLAEKILSLSEDPEYYMQIADNCFNRAKEYDISFMVKSYESVYKELTSKYI